MNERKDIVDRLRKGLSVCCDGGICAAKPCLCSDAADEIERLREDIKILKADCSNLRAELSGALYTGF